ncbi:hypothetical protein BJ165DRAFT_1419453, partial [Panaeolus papilionaceus]
MCPVCCRVGRRGGYENMAFLIYSIPSTLLLYPLLQTNICLRTSPQIWTILYYMLSVFRRTKNAT